MKFNTFTYIYVRSGDEAASNNLNEATSEEGIRELEKMINCFGYCNKIDVNHLLDYPAENDECLEVQSLEEIVASAIENPIEDDAEDDSIPLEPITRKEAFGAIITLQNFLLQFENTTPELLSAMRKIRDEIQLDLNFMKKQTTIDFY